MENRLVRIPVSFLIPALLTVAGSLLRTQSNPYIHNLRLMEKSLWFSIGMTPAQNIAAVAAYAGPGYLEEDAGGTP
jgi:hypothetical protein